MNENPKAIFKATSKRTGEVVMIADLFWFEEQGVHDLSGEGNLENWIIEWLGPPS